MCSEMRKANLRYYSSKGKAAYSDFSTFAQGRALARCNAIEFARDFSNQGEILVCEYGVGNGNFAKVFLDELKSKDAQLHSRTHYFLFDLSEKMLKDARKTLSSHGSICSFERFDAASEAPSQNFDYCRINELLSDLPADIYMKSQGKITSMDSKRTTSDLFVSKFLERVDEGRAIPFNFTAEKFLSSLCLAGRPGFRIDAFDYGFYSAEGIFIHPKEEWNSIILRKYGSQVTVDLNFPQLIASLASQGIAAAIESQKDYAERVLGMPLEISETGKGLDYVKAGKGSEGIIEDDGFYYLRIGR